MAEHVRATQLEWLGSAINEQLGRRYAGNRSVKLVGMGCGAALVESLAAQIGLQYRPFSSLVKIAGAGERADSLVKANICGPAVAVAYELAGVA